MTLRRLLKCGPWHEGGYDPPPRRRSDQVSDQGGNDDAVTQQA